MIEYQLLKAAEQGEFLYQSHLINWSKSIDETHFISLLLVFHAGNLEKVKILIENGAYVNITSYKYKQTPLHKAAANGKSK